MKRMTRNQKETKWMTWLQNKEARMIRSMLYMGYNDLHDPMSESNICCDNKEVEEEVRRMLAIANKRRYAREIDSWYCPHAKTTVYQFLPIGCETNASDNIMNAINQIRIRTMDYSRLYFK